MDEQLTLESSIELLLTQVPGPVRIFVLNELDSTTSALMTKHQLHVDHGGVLERELLLMLLGQSTPDEFVKALTGAGIEEGVVRNIVSDVNKDIFMRLREEERKEVSAPVKPAAAAVPNRTPVPIYSPLPATSIPPVPPSRVEPPANLPGQLPEPAPRPVPPPPHIEVPIPVAPKVVEQPMPQPDQHTRIMHTMARDMAALKGGADPLRVAHPAPPAWAENPTKPAPVAPAPVVPPQSHTEAVARPAPAPQPVVHAAPQEALRTHLKQYGVDPYREPVE